MKMRKQKITSNSIYLTCTSIKCNAKLILTVEPGIPIENIYRYFDKVGLDGCTQIYIISTRNMFFNKTDEKRKYSDFFYYFFEYYLIFDDSFGLMNQYHYTTLFNGDPDANTVQVHTSINA